MEEVDARAQGGLNGPEVGKQQPVQRSLDSASCLTLDDRPFWVMLCMR